MTKSNFKRSLCWIRRDIRLQDHCALHHALKDSEQVYLVFVFDHHIISKLNANSGDRRLTFICQALDDLNQELTSRGGALILRYGDPIQAIAEVVRELNIDALYYNRDYEPYAKKRDQTVQQQLSKKISVFSYKDHVIFEKNQIRKNDGTPYKVFTPYKNKWLETYHQLSEGRELKEYRPQDLNKKLARESKYALKTDSATFLQKHSSLTLLPSLYEGTRKKALTALNHFIKQKLDCYHEARDHISLGEQMGTSGISPYLRHGLLSIREAFRPALAAQGKGAEVWVSELIWREFYQMILDEFPHVQNSSFKKDYDNIKWPNDKKLFKAWSQGQTGFPIIDAGMRCLNQTGLMHNRMRMICASFLCKTLLVDWKWGEDYFAKLLMDFDLAANNGGWQWSSSSGCDAQPYFRIFNPFTQSEKFDPQGQFIKTYCPELKEINDKNIHRPSLLSQELQEKFHCHIGRDYPQEVVDYKKNRDKAIQLYKDSTS